MPGFFYGQTHRCFRTFIKFIRFTTSLHMKNISSKLPNAKTTIFTTIGNLARQHNAIDLSQGFPNFEADSKLMRLVTKAMSDGYNQYAPMFGSFPLREAIVQKIKTLHGKSYHIEKEITITVGATQAIYTAITAFINQGDEVIVFKPAYDCYEPAIAINGGVSILVEMNGDRFKIDWEKFRVRITPKTKMVIINTPHNPSGTLLSKNDMLALQQSLLGTDIILISDEVYEHIVFDDLTHESVSRFPDLASRSIVCGSFGKTFHVTGWKVGYCVAPAELMQEFRKIHQFNVFSVDHPTQRALAQYLQEPKHYLELSDFYQKKRDYFINALNQSSFKVLPSQGTYFQLLDYSALTDENDVSYAQKLITNHRLACIPISVFNIDQKDNQKLRFCFAKTQATLKKAINILNSLK